MFFSFPLKFATSLGVQIIFFIINVNGFTMVHSSSYLCGPSTVSSPLSPRHLSSETREVYVESRSCRESRGALGFQVRVVSRTGVVRDPRVRTHWSPASPSFT